MCETGLECYFEVKYCNPPPPNIGRMLQMVIIVRYLIFSIKLKADQEIIKPCKKPEKSYKCALDESKCKARTDKQIS